ncbi:hypothetical protein BHE74_00018508, partial [Ensete ventricosum]
MDTDTVRDMASFHPELLQLPEVSHLALKERPKMAEELYFQWLSLPETGKLVRILSLFYYHRNRARNPSSGGITIGLGGNTVDLGGNTAGMGGTTIGTVEKAQTLLFDSQAVKSLIEDAKSGSPLNAAGSSSTLNAATNSSLPSKFPAGSAPPLSPRSTSGSPRFMKRSSGAGLSPFGSPLKLVSDPVKEVIPQEDFKPVLRELLATHPGLEFLQGTPEFQERYGLTYRSVLAYLDYLGMADGKMGYEDFVYFILAEEDKSAEPSLEY